MGTWGVGIFSDDTAADVRSRYRQHVGDGRTGPDATDQVLIDFADIAADPGEGSVLWLALAATQVRCGRLEERVKARALSVIADGSDLRRWNGPTAGDLIRRRRAVLAKLAVELDRVPREPTPIRRRRRTVSPFAVGDVFAFRLDDGRHALLHVVGTYADFGGEAPIVDVLDWMSTTIPDAESAAAISVLKRQRPSSTAPSAVPHRLLILGSARNWRSRTVTIGTRPLTTPSGVRGGTALLWARLSDALARQSFS